jgi:hypothetical protein
MVRPGGAGFVYQNYQLPRLAEVHSRVFDQLIPFYGEAPIRELE